MIWTGRLISLAIILQSIEFFKIPAWPWEIVKKEFPKFCWPVMKNLNVLNAVRLAAGLAALVFPQIWIVFLLLTTTYLIAVRWRGTFNGGSDFMTFHVLIGWFVALMFPDAAIFGVAYIYFQSTMSFVVAGLTKLTQNSWRSGEALQTFLSRRGYEVKWSRPISWALIFFEMSFLFAGKFPFIFVPLAILFQIANVFVFGLNRFFFAWLATYPIYFYFAKI